MIHWDSWRGGINHLEAAFVNRWSGVGNSQESADSAPQFTVVIGSRSVPDGNARAVEEVDVEAADAPVRGRHRDVLIDDVGCKVRPARSHQIRTPFVEHSAAFHWRGEDKEKWNTNQTRIPVAVSVIISMINERSITLSYCEPRTWSRSDWVRQ